MRFIGLMLKFLIFLPIIILVALGVLFSIAVGVVFWVLTGRRRPRIKVYSSGVFSGPSARPDMFTRPPMRDVTPRPTVQLTNE